MIETTLVMKASHKVAKRFVSRTNNYSIALSFAMKAVWSQAKRIEYRNACHPEKFVEPTIESYSDRIIAYFRAYSRASYIFGVPTWLISENAKHGEYKLISHSAVAVETIEETEKAVKLAFTIDQEASTKRNPEYHGIVELWVPKSVMAA